MAIKFEDKKGGGKPAAESTKSKTSLEARFATPIGTDNPVNPDATSELPFGKPPVAEKKARKRL